MSGMGFLYVTYAVMVMLVVGVASWVLESARHITFGSGFSRWRFSMLSIHAATYDVCGFVFTLVR